MRFLSIFILGLILKSCFTTPPLNYYEENGECYPTLTNIQQMYDLKNETGVDYVWHDCDWISRSQRDSLWDVEFNRIWDEIVKKYDSIPN